MANLLKFTADEQLIILYELSNAVLIDALSQFATETKADLRVIVLGEVKKQIPKMSHANLKELVKRVRSTRDDAYNSAVDTIFDNNN